MYRILKSLALLLVLSLISPSLSAQARKRIVEHLVKDNETVYAISQRYATTVDKVYEINSWARSGIKPGDKLIVYVGSNYQSEAPSKSKTSDSTAKKPTAPTQSQSNSPTTPAKPSTPKANNGQHTIEPGETLYRVARLYSVSEAELQRANPGINAENFPIGFVLRIPKADSTQLTTGQEPSTELTRPVVRPVKVLIMLPFRKATRYLEFYQGLLMGVNDLKKDGLSVYIKALEADTDEDVAKHISRSEVAGYDFVIGGVNAEQITALSRAAQESSRANPTHYIVPFMNVEHGANSRLVQLNQSPEDVRDKVIELLAKRYAGRSIVVARRNEDAEGDFAFALRNQMRKAGIDVQVANISTHSLANLSANQLIVPASPDKGLAQAIFRSLGANRQAEVFGYPQWQSYGDSFLRLLHQHKATIYSTFYFDKYTSESKQFLMKFNAWYNKKVLDSFPKYSVMGYDVARYFIRAHSAYGASFVQHSAQLPSDGLQMDIELERSNKHEGYTNSRFYLVQYEVDGTVTRSSY